MFQLHKHILIWYLCCKHYLKDDIHWTKKHLFMGGTGKSSWYSTFDFLRLRPGNVSLSVVVCCFSKYPFMNITKMSNSLETDPTRRFVGHVLGSVIIRRHWLAKKELRCTTCLILFCVFYIWHGQTHYSLRLQDKFISVAGKTIFSVFTLLFFTLLAQLLIFTRILAHIWLMEIPHTILNWTNLPWIKTKRFVTWNWSGQLNRINVHVILFR